jgi:putative photosynthetic complex assembly protein 2
VVEFGVPVLAATFLWWFSTGVFAWLDGLSPRRAPVTFAGASVLGLAGLAGAAWSAGQATVTGSFVGFASALLVWGWNEMAFLLGYVTGPRRGPATPGAVRGQRFREAFAAILWHELLSLAVTVAVVLLAAGGENPVAAWTIALLFVMRISAKLNVFLGVRNLNEEFLPPKLAHLATYFRRRAMNALFPASALAGAATTVLLAVAAGAPGTGPAEVAALSLLATLAALGFLEHALMVLPLPSAALWSWYLRPRAHVAQLAPDPEAGTALAPSTIGRR